MPTADEPPVRATTDWPPTPTVDDAAENGVGVPDVATPRFLA